MLKRHHVGKGARRSSPDLTSSPDLSLPPAAALCFLWQLQVCRGSGVKTAAEARLLSLCARSRLLQTRVQSMRLCGYFRHIGHTRVFLALKDSVCTHVCTSVGICAQHGMCVSLSGGVYMHMSVCAHLHVRVSARVCVCVCSGLASRARRLLASLCVLV